MKKYIYTLLVVVFVGMAATISIQRSTIHKRTDQRDTALRNAESLLADVNRYRVGDSLSAIQIGSLSLSLKEYEKYRADDATLIKQLRADRKSLQDVVSAQTKTITQLENAPVKDSIIYVEGRADTVQCVSFSDQWLDFIGCMNGSVRIESRDALLITTSVEYKRALGFLWRTKKIKSQSSSALSKNPRTIITDMEHVIISK